MLETFTLTLLLFVSITAFGQKNQSAKKPAKHSIQWLQKHYKNYWDDCVFTYKLSLQARLQKYPFSKSVKIIAVSYPAWYPTHGDSDNQLTGLMVKNQVLNQSNLKEIKELTAEQTAQLTNLIYNTDYKVKDGLNTIFEGKCFEPRNAVVFFDVNDKVIDYLEVCFQCANYSSQSDKLDVGTSCNQKYDLLKKWFLDVGLKYGTVETKD